MATVLKRCNGCPEELSFRFLDAVLRSPDEVMPDMLALTESLMADERCLTSLVAIMSLYWMGVDIPRDFQDILRHLHDQAMRNDFLWVAMESAELLATLDESQTAMRQTACDLADRLDCRFLTNIIAPNAAWKQSLEELIEVTRRMREPEQTTRLCWLVEYRDGQLELIPKEQRRSLTGEWTKGRTIAFKRLFLGREIDYLSSQDREICAALQQVEMREGRNSGYAFDPGRALPGLIGHPAVFLRRSPETPVEIVAGEPELVVERREEALFIHFCQDIGEGEVAVWPETATRFRVIQIRDEHRRVARITGRDGLLVPMAASKKVLAAIGNIASFMTVHSSIEMPGEGLPAEAGTARRHAACPHHPLWQRLPYRDVRPPVHQRRPLPQARRGCGQPGHRDRRPALPHSGAISSSRRPGRGRSRRAVPCSTWPSTTSRRTGASGTWWTRRSACRCCSRSRRSAIG